MEECIICFEETTEFNFYRCAHKVCSQCYPRIKTCPICKTPNETVIVTSDTVIVMEPRVRRGIRVENIITTFHLTMCAGILLLFISISIFFYRGK